MTAQGVAAGSAGRHGVTSPDSGVHAAVRSEEEGLEMAGRSAADRANSVWRWLRLAAAGGVAAPAVHELVGLQPGRRLQRLQLRGQLLGTGEQPVSGA